MKKFVVMFLALIAFGMCAMLWAAAASSPVAGDWSSNYGAPSNVKVVSLVNAVATTDTLYTSSGNVVYGPYSITCGRGRPAAKGFRAIMPVGGLASGDSIQFAYQMTYGSSIADTGTAWTVVDTLITGKKGTFVDISSLPGLGIVFRLLNIDGSKVGLVANKKCRVAFQTTSTESTDKQ